MWKEFLRALFSVVRSPSLLLVAVLGIALQMGVLWLLADPLTQLSGEILLSQEFFGSSAVNPWLELPALGGMLFWMGIAVLISLVINALLGVAFARFALRQQERKSESFESVAFAFSRGKRLIVWALFTALLGLAWALVLAPIWILGGIHWMFLLLLVLVWAIIGFAMYLVVLLGLAFIGLTDATVKEGLQQSAAFLKPRMGSFGVFVIVLAVLLGLWSGLGSALADSFSDETLSFVVTVLFWLVGIIIANLAIPFYYLHTTRDVPLNK